MRLFGFIVFLILLALAFLCLLGCILALLMLRPLLALGLFLACLTLVGAAVVFGAIWLIYRAFTL